MSPTQRIFVKHLTLIVGMSMILVVAIAYPFLAGRYDTLAVPLSTMVQVFGVVGQALVPIGLLWPFFPKFGFAFAVLAVIAGIFISLILALFATLSVGNAFGVLTLGVSAIFLLWLTTGIKQLKRMDHAGIHPAVFYLTLLPLVTLAAQCALATPLSKASRDRAISNASEFIDDIEKYRVAHGRYPVGLQAQYGDYHPDVIGVDQYRYMPFGESYNLSFEQPRFLLDRFGTREWVVYNPADQHRVYSHTAWLVPSSDMTEPAQGWYDSGQTVHLHWMYFGFD